MPNMISNTVSVLGGAALGAVAMYLLDPDNGESRRDDVSGAAAGAVSSTKSAVGATAGGASESAQSVAHSISAYARKLADRVAHGVGSATDAVSDAGDSVADSVKSAHKQTRKGLFGAVDSIKSWSGDLVGHAKDTRDDWIDAASSRVGQAKLSARRALGEPEPHPVVTATSLTAGGLGVLIVGAGLMYYLDPERGRARRAQTCDRLASIARHSGARARGYGHHLGNRAHGLAAQARHAVPESWVGASGTDESSTPTATPAAS